MPFYHDTKDQALLAGAVYAEYWHTRAELEPNNGWVLVLAPKSKQVFQWPLADILDYAEIDLTSWNRLAIRPRERKAITPKVKESAIARPDAGPAMPRGSGATAQVHAIANKMNDETPLGRADRARVIAACVEAGIKETTASTQWSKWIKAHGG